MVRTCDCKEIMAFDGDDRNCAPNRTVMFSEEDSVKIVSLKPVVADDNVEAEGIRVQLPV